MQLNSYDEILQRARRELTPDEQLKLVAELSQCAGARNGPRRITELEGLGKEIWADIDPDEYVRLERDSWDG